MQIHHEAPHEEVEEDLEEIEEDEAEVEEEEIGEDEEEDEEETEEEEVVSHPEVETGEDEEVIEVRCVVLWEHLTLMLISIIRFAPFYLFFSSLRRFFNYPSVHLLDPWFIFTQCRRTRWRTRWRSRWKRWRTRWCWSSRRTRRRRTQRPSRTS